MTDKPVFKPRKPLARTLESKKRNKFKRPQKPCKSGESRHCYHIHEAHLCSPEERLLVCCHCGRAKSTRGHRGPHGVHLSPRLLVTTGIDRKTDPEVVNRKPYQPDHEAGTQPRTTRRNHRPSEVPE